jgi:putative ABC transport system ATP-binding protein
VDPDRPRETKQQKGTGMLTAEGVTVRYGDLVAVHDATLTVEAGTVLAVTGPSGAGKSSLLWALAGALRPSGGRVRVDGSDVADRRRAAELGVSLVPQGNGLAAHLTAYENVLVPLLALGVGAREAREASLRALSDVGLEEATSHLVEELSGGQQQRVAVARSLAARPRVLLSDEPTSELDSATRERVVGLLRGEADRGAAVVLATHDPAASRAGDVELALDEGWPRWV